MTKKELKIIESFLEDMKNTDEDIEVFSRMLSWIRQVYHAEGPKKLEDYNKDL